MHVAVNVVLRPNGTICSKHKLVQTGTALRLAPQLFGLLRTITTGRAICQRYRSLAFSAAGETPPEFLSSLKTEERMYAACAEYLYSHVRITVTARSSSEGQVFIPRQKEISLVPISTHFPLSTGTAECGLAPATRQNGSGQLRRSCARSFASWVATMDEPNRFSNGEFDPGSG